MFQNPQNFRAFPVVPNSISFRAFPHGIAPVNINMQRRMPAIPITMNLNINNQLQPQQQLREVGINGNINVPNVVNVPNASNVPDVSKMDKNARTDYYGEKIYDKIMKDQKFAAYESYFPKIVGIFLDLSDGVVERLLNDNQYF